MEYSGALFTIFPTLLALLIKLVGLLYDQTNKQDVSLIVVLSLFLILSLICFKEGDDVDKRLEQFVTGVGLFCGWIPGIIYFISISFPWEDKHQKNPVTILVLGLFFYLLFLS